MTQAIIGRELERAWLDDAVDLLGNGKGSAVVLAGAPGIGKSFLLHHVRARAEHAGLAVVRGRAHQLEQARPFGVVLDILRTLAQEPGAVAASEAITSVAKPGQRFDARDVVVDAIEGMALAHATAIIIDDLQWADPESAAVVFRLVRLSTTVPLLVAIGTRPGDALRHAMTFDPHVIELGPLDDAGVAALATSRLGAPPDDSLQTLLDAAGGNPLFVTELLAALERDGLVKVRGDVAVALTAAVPTSAKHAILSRLAYLDDHAMHALRLAAVLGSSFSIDELAAVIGVAPSECIRRLDLPLRAGLLTDDGESLSFHHDIVHAAVYDDIPTSTRRALHLEVGRALAAAGAPADRVAPQMALGAQRGDEGAIRWLQAAAATTLAASPSSAIELCEALVKVTPARDERRVDALLGLAQARLLSGFFREAESAAREAEPLATTTSQHAAIDRVIDRVLSMSCRYDEALERIDRRLADDRLDSWTRLPLLADRLQIAGFCSNAASALQEARDLLAQSSNHEDPVAALRVVVISTFLAACGGAFDTAVQLADDTPRRSAAIPPGATAVGIAALASGGYRGGASESAVAYAIAGETERAFAVLGSLQRAAHEQGMRDLYTVATGTQAIISAWCGRWDEAVVHADAAMGLYDELNLRFSRAAVCASAVVGCAHRGDLDEAAAWLARADAAVAMEVQLAPLVEHARSVLCERRGDHQAAVAASHRAWAAVEANDMDGVGTIFAADQLRLLLAEGRPTTSFLRRIDDLQQRSPGAPSIAILRRRCAALVEGDADALRVCADDYRQIGRSADQLESLVDAAEQYADHGRPEEARSAALAAGEVAVTQHADADADRVGALQRRLGVRRGARGPRRVSRLGWGALTESEQRIVDLAATGLTNRQMGERLYLSPRTVETHLASAYRKLGVSTRAELAAAHARRDP